MLPPLEGVREPLIKTKLSAPQVRARLVSRPRLLNLMAEGVSRALTLVSAPAGYGKTTLLTDWIAEAVARKSRGAPNAGWLALDEEDDNPVRFASYLVAALENAASTSLGESQAVLRSFPPLPLQDILRVVINEAHALPQPVCLVLDDYQFISAPAIHAGLAFLLDHLPTMMHLVIATRSDPPLPLARLRARSQLTEIRADQLRFTSDEAAAFLSQVMGLSLTSDDILALDSRTEGWIAGLQMAALSMRGRTDFSAFIRAFSGSHRYILDYLADEVLNRQSSDVQQFLVLTSVLDRMCAPLCSAVTGDTEAMARERLEYLDRANLYLIALDDERCWYRYHHLFADLLKARLKQSEAGLMPRLHVRASEWHEHNGHDAEAIQHAFWAADYERAASLIEQRGPPLWTGGDPSLLMLAARLPAEALLSHPKLSLYQAWLWIAQGQTQTALPLLRKLTETFPADATSSEAVWMRSVAGLFAAYIDFTATGEAPKPLPDYHDFGLIPEQDLGLRDTAELAYAMLTYRFGDADLAAEIVAGSVQRDLAANGVLAIFTGIPFLARVRLMQGRLREAAAWCQDYLPSADSPEKRYLYGAGGLAIILGEILREWNDLEGAEEHIRKGLQASEPSSNVLYVTIGQSALARLQLARGDLAAVHETLRGLEQRLEGRAVPPDMQDEIDALKVRLWLAQGDLARAGQWADHIRFGETPDRKIELNLLTLARVRIAQGQYHEAQHILETMGRISGLDGRMGRQLRRTLLLAIALAGQGQWPQAFGTLESCLSLAEPEGHMRALLDAGEGARSLLDAYIHTPRPAHSAYVRKLLDAFPKAAQASPVAHTQAELLEPITPRELEVLRLMAEGDSNRQIAAKLVIAEGTVKFYVHNILEKLQVHSRTQALLKAKELNLI